MLRDKVALVQWLFSSHKSSVPPPPYLWMGHTRTTHFSHSPTPYWLSCQPRVFSIYWTLLIAQHCLILANLPHSPSSDLWLLCLKPAFCPAFHHVIQISVLPSTYCFFQHNFVSLKWCNIHQVIMPIYYCSFFYYYYYYSIFFLWAILYPLWFQYTQRSNNVAI